MEEKKFAQLNNEELKEIKELEEKLNVTLIAYDSSISNNKEQVKHQPY